MRMIGKANEGAGGTIERILGSVWRLFLALTERMSYACLSFGSTTLTIRSS